MKYFLATDTNENRYIIVAQSENNVVGIAAKAKINLSDLYVLEEDTFKDEGFLITENSRPLT